MCSKHLGHTETLPTGTEILLSVPESVPMGSILPPLEERKNIHGERVEPSLYLKFIWARSFSPSQRKLDSGTKRGNHSSKGGASPALCANTRTSSVGSRFSMGLSEDLKFLSFPLS